MKNIRNSLGLFIVFWFCFSACSESKLKEESIILNIPNLIHKTPTEVVAILGKPDTVYYEQVLRKTFLVQRYKNLDLEIQYIKGKSNDIIINDPIPIEFKKESLSLFGIKPAQPTEHREKEMLKWKNYSGLKTINFYKVRTDSAGNIVSYKIFFKV